MALHYLLISVVMTYSVLSVSAVVRSALCVHLCMGLWFTVLCFNGVLHASQFAVFSSSPPPPPPPLPLCYLFFLLLFSTGCPVQRDECLDGGWVDGAHGWAAGIAGFGVINLPVFGDGSSSLQVPGHSTSMGMQALIIDK